MTNENVKRYIWMDLLFLLPPLDLSALGWAGRFKICVDEQRKGRLMMKKVTYGSLNGQNGEKGEGYKYKVHGKKGPTPAEMMRKWEKTTFEKGKKGKS